MSYSLAVNGDIESDKTSDGNDFAEFETEDEDDDGYEEIERKSDELEDDYNNDVDVVTGKPYKN